MGSAAQAQGKTASCDRACLIKLTDAYVAALAKHDPKAVPLAADVRFVENVKKAKPGEGLWQSTTGGRRNSPSMCPIRDAERGLDRHDGARRQKPVIVAIRLKLDKGRIVEAEHLVADVNGADNLARLQVPRPGLVSEVPANARISHDRLVAIGASYYDALDDNDGSKIALRRRLRAARERHGHGSAQSAAARSALSEHQPQCKAQLDSNGMAYISTIGNRRLFAADPVTGLAMGLSQFHHALDNLPYPVTLKDGTRGERRIDSIGRTDPFDLPAAHIFKVGADGKVHEIEAMGFIAPYNAPSGWQD